MTRRVLKKKGIARAIAIVLAMSMVMPGTALAAITQEPLDEAVVKEIEAFDEAEDAANLSNEEMTAEDSDSVEASAAEETPAEVSTEVETPEDADEEIAPFNTDEDYAPVDAEGESIPGETEQDSISDAINGHEAVTADEEDSVIEEEFAADEGKSVPARQEESTASEENNDNTKVTVKFDLNGGVLADLLEKPEYEFYYRMYKDGITVKKGEYISLNESVSMGPKSFIVVNRLGYHFDGWTETKDGDEVIGRGYKPTKDITLYAKWSEACIVMFDLNGGTLEDQFETEDAIAYEMYKKGAATGSENWAVDLPKAFWIGSEEFSVVTRDGYHFDGWTETKDGSDVVGVAYYPSRDITLYAKWSKLYTLQFDLNGGVLADKLETEDEYYYRLYNDGAVRTENEPVYLPITFWIESDSENAFVVTRDGYQFDGWTETKDGDEVVDYPYTLTKDTTLYAKWSKAYNIRFDLNHGVLADQSESTDASVLRMYRNGITCSSVYLRKTIWVDSKERTIVTRDGYRFEGWTETRNGQDVIADTYYYPSKDITLYAKWSKGYTGYSVEFDLNGGAISDKLETVDADSYWMYLEGTVGNESNRVYLPVTFRVESDSEEAFIVTRDGFQFVGWTETKDGTDVISGSYYPSKDITLYAKWIKAYTIKFDLNGGVLADQLETANAGMYKMFRDGIVRGSVSLSGYEYFRTDSGDELAVVRDGYQLVGWTETKDGTNVVSDPYFASKDITLYAKWIKAYSIKFDLNGGALADELETADPITYKMYRYGTTKGAVCFPTTFPSYPEYAPVAVRDGYVFGGWAETKGGTDDMSNGFYYPSKDITLYAIWLKANIAVTFDLNGGVLWDQLETTDAGMYQLYKNGTTVTEGDYVYLPDGVYWTGSGNTYPVIRDGYVFGGWTETKDGTEAVDSNYYPSDDVTLYVKWLKLCTVKFDLNGGALRDKLEAEDEDSYRLLRDGAAVAEGSPVDIKEYIWDGSEVVSPVTRDGYLFDGWTETKNGTNVVAYTYYPTKDITLYAKWSKAYNVTFDLNGGVLADKLKTADPSLYKMYSEGKAGNEKRPLELYKVFWIEPRYYPVANRNGYVFDGWTEVKDSDDVLSFGYFPTKDITLYAKWSKTCTVKLDLNGGAWNTRFENEYRYQYENGYSAKIGSEITLPDTADASVIRNGYKLRGWTTTQNGSTILSGQYTATKDITLYAKWGKLYTVTLDGGGGRFPSDNNAAKKTIQYAEGDSIGTLFETNIPKNGSKAFAGWYKDSGLTKPAKRSDTVTGNVTYYAKWSTNTYKITVSNLTGASYTNRATGKGVNGSTAASYSFYIQKGDRIGNLGARKNNEEARFFLDKACKSKPVYDDYVPTGDTTVYAKWYGLITITIDPSGGMLNGEYFDEDTTHNMISRKGLMVETLPTVKKEGYYFAGWYDTADPAKILTASHVFTKNTTIKAKWEEGVKITFNANGGKLAQGSDSVIYIKAKTAIGSRAPEVSRNGYVFGGWKSSATNKVVSSIGSEAPAGDTTYTAVWSKPTMVSVTLQAGDGSFYKEETSTYLSKLVVKVPENTTLAKSGILDQNLTHDQSYKKLILAGWSLTKDGSALKSTYAFTKNVTLYPVWGECLNVALVTNGGVIDNCLSNRPKVYSVAKNTVISLPTGSRMEKEGLVFAGWYTDPSFTTKVSAPAKYKVTKSCYLYAKWQEKSSGSGSSGSSLGKTARGDMFNLANNVKVTWQAVSGAKYYKVYREGITNSKETQKDPVIVTTGLVGWDNSPGLTNGHAYRYTIVASTTGAGDPSGDSSLSYSKVMYRLKTVVIRSVKNTAAGQVTVTYDKTTCGDSYVLQYSESKDMTDAKSKVVQGASNTSCVIGGLKKGKTYYFSIRVRKKVDGINYYTTFGVPKKVAVTK